MARRYSRDNRGRFAGGGGGATARGGRLKTAAGNKRKTQTVQAGGAKAAGTIKGKVKRDPGAAGKVKQGKASVATAAKKRIAVTTFKTNTDIGRRGVVSMSARAKVRRSQNVKSLATEKGKEVLDRIQGAGFRRGSRETKYNAPGSVGAKRIAKTAATQSRAKAFAQQQVYNKGGGAYRGQRPEFNWKRSRATVKPAAAPKAAKPAPKVDTSMKGVAARRARALAPRTSTYLSQKLNTQSSITRSAANAIYNKQRSVGKQLGLDKAVIRNPIGIMSKTSGSTRNRAEQLRDAARKRVVGGRRR